MTADELAAAISKLTANTAYSRDGTLARAAALSECIAAGDWRLYYRVDDAVRRVTVADVQRVAKKYFTEDQRVTGWFIPQNEAPAETAPPSGAAATSTATALSPPAAVAAEKSSGASVANGSKSAAAAPQAPPKTAATPQTGEPAAEPAPVAKIAPGSRAPRSTASICSSAPRV